MILYFDPFMGMAGDMTVSALVDAGADPGEVNRALAGLGLDGLAFRFEKVHRQGIRATFGSVVLPHDHAHRTLGDIRTLLGRAALPERVGREADAVFVKLAEAEAAVHGCSPEEVHFHEVGALDSIADIVGACAAWESLGAPPAECGPLNLGSGFTVMEHGTFPVPPPAVVELLKGVPTFSFGPPVERTTPTGAALAVGLSRKFGPRPAGRIRTAGYGAGTKDTVGAPNVLRVFLVEEAPAEGAVVVMEANLDDMTPEYLGGALETLRREGARDVSLTPVQGKKHRPGWVVTLLCDVGDERRFGELLLRCTSTAGVRFSRWERMELAREEERVETPWGTLRVKRLSPPGGTVRLHPEWDDVEALAQKAGLSPLELAERLRPLLPSP
jgi:hypothetical protein